MRISERDIKSVGFVHCVGSRDEKARNSQCSKVCCITAIKQAIEMKEKFPDAEIWCFYMDLRLFGKKFEDFYTKAQRDYGIHFVRGRVSEVSEDINSRVIVKAEDTLAGNQSGSLWTCLFSCRVWYAIQTARKQPECSLFRSIRTAS